MAQVTEPVRGRNEVVLMTARGATVGQVNEDYTCAARPADSGRAAHRSVNGSADSRDYGSNAARDSSSRKRRQGEVLQSPLTLHVAQPQLSAESAQRINTHVAVISSRISNDAGAVIIGLHDAERCATLQRDRAYSERRTLRADRAEVWNRQVWREPSS